MKRVGASSIEITTPRSRVAALASSAQIRNGLLAASAALAYLALAHPFALSLLGPRAAHMALHILLMNALAPALASVIIADFGVPFGRHRLNANNAPDSKSLARASCEIPVPAFSQRALIAATVLQLALLWAWHAPNLWGLTLREPLVHALMQASLLGASLTFWLAILAEKGVARWRGVVALLLTGKLSCLLGVLLLLAPRLLYADVPVGHDHAAAHGDELLADQRLAGLLMLIACPFCYVLAGIAIAAKWLQDLETTARERGLSCLDYAPPTPR